MRTFLGIAAGLTLASGVALVAASDQQVVTERRVVQAPPSWAESGADDMVGQPMVRRLSILQGRGAELGITIKDLDEPIEGKNVLIVEDILDTGLTLSYLRKIFLQHRPKSLRIAALLDKPSRRIEKIDADYVGFSIPNLFVIGYGMDYAERYRNLPDICLMSPDHPE